MKTELQRADVAHSDRLDAPLMRPEEVQGRDAPEANEVGRRLDVAQAGLVGVVEAELEQVHGHEGQENETRDRQAQHADALTAPRSQLHVPRSLQVHEGVE